ncbi:MAG: hypothetical protein MSC30_01195 [Gaiellaceae bacterium MAG52_C11]|nr:hypothetical protein [Candidatus Gaiellasilicea maunaloa]
MNAGVQVFVYPEELDHTGPSDLAAQVLELGCDAVSVAVAYHPARRVFPRHRRVSVLTRSTLYLEPERSRYGSVVPTGVPWEGLLRFREACDLAGLRFRAWIVGLHNGELAAAHPHAAARLLDGSPAGHSLCPSAPEAVEYLAALAGDVAAQLSPEAVDLEAGFYPAWEPSYTLTLALEPLSERARLLGAQCFCESCRVFLGAEAQARAYAAAGPPFGAGADDEGILAELAAARAASAAQLVAATAASVHAEGSLLRVFASGPPEQAALQGVAPESVAAADALLFGCGPLAGDELLSRFADLRTLAGRSGSVSTNWIRGRTALVADVERLVAAGAEGLALYNLSLVPEAGLEAFRAAAQAFRGAVPA